MDLHLHSTHSDGLLTPRAMMEEAAAAGLSLVALTDHDTLDGLPEAAEAASGLGLDLVPGVEISCRLRAGGERHLLGYGFDAADGPLAEALGRNRASRARRLGRVLAALEGEGVHVTEEQVRREAGGRSVGRPHVADALVRAGKAASRREAFDRWLADGKPAAPAHEGIYLDEAIAALHGASGIAVLAHPGRRKRGIDLAPLAALGLDGVEATHPSHGPEDVKMIREQAARLGLVETGGSDCHGDRDGLRALRARSVQPQVAEAFLEALRRKAAPRAGGASGRGWALAT